MLKVFETNCQMVLFLNVDFNWRQKAFVISKSTSRFIFHTGSIWCIYNISKCSHRRFSGTSTDSTYSCYTHAGISIRSNLQLTLASCTRQQQHRYEQLVRVENRQTVAQLVSSKQDAKFFAVCVCCFFCLLRSHGGCYCISGQIKQIRIYNSGWRVFIPFLLPLLLLILLLMNWQFMLNHLMWAIRKGVLLIKCHESCVCCCCCFFRNFSYSIHYTSIFRLISHYVPSF